MTATAPREPALFTPASEPVVRRVATELLEHLDALASAMAVHLHEQVPELGPVSDRALLAATRRSCEANIRELLVMLRARIPATAFETPTEALAYARFLAGRGVGFLSLVRTYELGAGMFGPLTAAAFERAASSSGQPVDRELVRAVHVFVARYIDRVLDRFSAELDAPRADGDGLSPQGWTDPRSVANARALLDQLATADRGGGAGSAGRAAGAGSTGVTVARTQAEQALKRFSAAIDMGARDPDLARRLSLAATTVRLELADEPDLSVVLQLTGGPIATADASAAVDAELVIASIDLERLFSHDFNLAMAIARGRVRVHGPVRRFLRVMPIVRQLPQPGDLAGLSETLSGFNVAVDGDAEEIAFDPGTEAVLDQAAEYQYELHQGAMEYQEEAPGYFWSIECDDVHKAFDTNVVLNGLTVGVPEGMITVILGPSGTGKSVLISHLIGLMFPDRGEVRVHGHNVADLRMSELLKLRQKFGILFQDGALFGSMSVYDNVAFPLRQHTDKSEAEIAEIVNHRLAEVGMERAAGRSPGELSGGMKKRAGFARALVLDPEIVMFDEPDSGLDPVRTALLCELIEKVHAENGGTYIVITHNIAAARQIAEYIIVLWKGRIVQSGDKDDMLTSPNPFVRQFLAGRPRGPLGME